MRIACRLLIVVAAFGALAGACTSGPEPTPHSTPIALPSPIREARTVPLADGSIRIEAVSARAVANQPYRYIAFTHCGFTASTFDFDGSFWTISGAAALAAGLNGPNPPDGIGNPTDGGVIVLTGPDSAIWIGQQGARIALARGPGEVTVFGCD